MKLETLRNIGIAAHIDAGKTTLTERFLYYAGRIHRAGNVDAGTTTTDYQPQERERGITITSAAVPLSWKRGDVTHPMNLIDTPGHVDFTIEVERSLRVLDGAVAVFSAVEGVQAQSETVWRQANRYGVPRLCFVNKMDRIGADFERTYQAMQERLRDSRCVAIQIPIGAEHDFAGVIDLVSMTARIFHGEGEDTAYEEGPVPEEMREAANVARAAMLEKLADFDDSLMDKVLSESPISETEIRGVLRRATIALKCQPVLCGSALKFRGVQAVLDAVCDYLPSPLERPAQLGVDPKDRTKTIVCQPDASEPFAGLAFKVIGKKTGDLIFVRVYSGVLKSGTRLYNPNRDKKENVSRLLRMIADQEVNIEDASAGDIVAVIGLRETVTGDTLCDARRPVMLGRIEFPATVISKSVEPETNDDKNRLLEALTRMGREDPTFAWTANPETGEVIIRGMGELHLTILTERLTRPPPVGLGLPVRVGRPKVAYRETIVSSVEAHGQFERVIGGKNQTAGVRLRIEPMPEAKPEEPVSFVNALGSGGGGQGVSGGGVLSREFVAAIRQGVEEAARTGVVAGYPLIQVKVTLTGATVHPTDSTEMAFTQAAYQAFDEGCRSAGAMLLEPYMRMEITTPDQYVGAIQGDLNRRQAEIAGVESRGELSVIEAFAPLSSLFGYEDDLRGRSQGRAGSTMEFARYAAAVGGQT